MKKGFSQQINNYQIWCRSGAKGPWQERKRKQNLKSSKIPTKSFEISCCDFLFFSKKIIINFIISQNSKICYSYIHQLILE
jgi:hypothetical protein